MRTAALLLFGVLGSIGGDADRLREREEVLAIVERGALEAEAHAPVRLLWGRYLPLLERHLQEAEAAGDRPAQARLFAAVGLTRFHLGEYTAALALFQQQRATFETLGDTKGLGQAQMNVGFALVALARYGDAIEAFEKSRASLEQAGDASGVARVEHNLGSCHRYVGNYAAALQALGRSLRAREAAGDRAALPSTLRVIGEVYRLQGAHEQALDYFRRSYAIAAAAGQRMAMGTALQGEGTTLLELDRPEEALIALDRSMDIQAVLDDDAASVREAVAEAHRSLWASGSDGFHRERALFFLQGSLETAERRQDFSLLVRTQREIATLRLAESAPVALDLAHRAVETARSHALREELWPALLVAARAERALGHTEQAEAALREAVDVIEEQRAQTVGPEAFRAAFLVSRAAPYQDLLALLAERGRSWEALAVAERSRGRVLLDVLAGGRPAIGHSLSDGERLEERRLVASVLATSSELRALQRRSDRDAVQMAQLTALRTERRLALEDFRTRQYAAHPELRVLRGESRLLSPGDVRHLLADGHTTLLEYALAGRDAYVFVLFAGPSGEPSLEVHRLEMESGELVRLAEDLRTRLAARNLDFGEPTARLHHVLLGPARIALQRARHVVVVPDGPLWELPFQALRPLDGPFFIEQVAVSYAPSLSVLRDMQALRRRRVRPDRALLALGNPDLGRKVRPGSALLSVSLPPLPETEVQVREIFRLYAPRTADVRVGAMAREPWVKAEAPHYGILHLATHGVLDDASPLYSELVLAAPTAGERDDGLLEAREILDLDLGADLAVLSACETARGRAGAGEGLIGMTWAFFVAGCPTTVASQWKVEAASTNELMVAFHRHLRAGRTPADALRLAALAELRSGDRRHPFYWAGFVAMGDALSPLVPPLLPAGVQALR